MKKTLVILSVLLIGCTKEPPPCSCELNTYRNVDITSYELISTQLIECEEERSWKDDDQVTFYIIENCN